MRRALGSLLIAVALAGCAVHRPAPVVDRQPTSSTARTPPATVVEPRKDERPETYTVKRGDTLYSIALDQGVDWRELAQLNGIGDPARLRVGDVLRVRPASAATTAADGGVQVNPVTGSGSIASRSLGGSEPTAAALPPPASVSPLKTEPKAQRLPYSEQNLALLQQGDGGRPAVEPLVGIRTEPSPRPAPLAKPEVGGDNVEDGVEWQWPAAGKLLSGFSENGPKGMEFAGRIGDPVYASAAGKVVYSGSGLRGYGKLVIIKHNEKYLSAYAHNNQILVKEGQSVAKGQKIAEIGSTDADQPKLHFEIRRFGKPVDPALFLPVRPS